MRENITPADIIVSGYFDEPMIAAELRNMAKEAILMGVNLNDPELMGSWLTELGEKVKKQVEDIKSVSINTKQGQANIESGGITYTDTVKPAITTSVSSSSASQFDFLKNPFFLISIAGLIISMMRGKK